MTQLLYLNNLPYNIRIFLKDRNSYWRPSKVMNLSFRWSFHFTTKHKTHTIGTKTSGYCMCACVVFKCELKQFRSEFSIHRRASESLFVVMIGACAEIQVNVKLTTIQGLLTFMLQVQQ